MAHYKREPAGVYPSARTHSHSADPGGGRLASTAALGWELRLPLLTACKLASQSVQALASSPGGSGACEHDLGTYRAHVSTWNRAVEVDD